MGKGENASNQKQFKLFESISVPSNSFPLDSILDWSELKTFEDDKIKVAQMVFDRVENIVGKGENAGYQHFLLFPPCFQKASSFRGSLKLGIASFYDTEG